jgi:hypothetical protein
MTDAPVAPQMLTPALVAALVNGRGAWTKKGFPTGYGPYYCQVTAGPLVGSQATLGPDYNAVHYGARAVQMLINSLGYTPALTVDGVLGPKSDAAIKWAQTKAGSYADGLVGPRTCKAILKPVFAAAETKYLIPDHLLFGQLGNESGLDVGALGYYDNRDRGLAQINSRYHPEITDDLAFDPTYALTFCGRAMWNRYSRYRSQGATVRLAWDCAVAGWNNPQLADQWAADGVAPYVAGRLFQIDEYVAAVRRYATTW